MVAFIYFLQIVLYILSFIFPTFGAIIFLICLIGSAFDDNKVTASMCIYLLCAILGHYIRG